MHSDNIIVIAALIIGATLSFTVGGLVGSTSATHSTPQTTVTFEWLADTDAQKD